MKWLQLSVYCLEARVFMSKQHTQMVVEQYTYLRCCLYHLALWRHFMLPEPTEWCGTLSTEPDIEPAIYHVRDMRHRFPSALSHETYILENNFFLNIFQDCIQPFGHEMLSWVRLHGINSHSVSPPSPLASWYQFYCLVNRDTRALVACPELLVRKLRESGIEPATPSDPRAEKP